MSNNFHSTVKFRIIFKALDLNTEDGAPAFVDLFIIIR